MRGRGRLCFSDLVDDDDPPEAIVANFLAILELYKRGLVSVRQDELFGDIEIAHVEGAGAYELDDSVIAELREDFGDEALDELGEGFGDGALAYDEGEDLT